MGENDWDMPGSRAESLTSHISNQVEIQEQEDILILMLFSLYLATQTAIQTNADQKKAWVGSKIWGGVVLVRERDRGLTGNEPNGSDYPSHQRTYNPPLLHMGTPSPNTNTHQACVH